jgi:hypothetical protein
VVSQCNYKENIEGNPFGITVKKIQVNGRNYYTNIFAKI